MKARDDQVVGSENRIGWKLFGKSMQNSRGQATSRWSNTIPIR